MTGLQIADDATVQDFLREELDLLMAYRQDAVLERLRAYLETRP